MELGHDEDKAELKTGRRSWDFDVPVVGVPEDLHIRNYRNLFIIFYIILYTKGR